MDLELAFNIPIPDNANYIAQEADGTWEWFEELPYTEGGEWQKFSQFSIAGFLCDGIPPEDYTVELYELIRS